MIYREADKFITEHHPDFIIATGEPFILFRYGHLLSKKHQLPWIADYRDTWTNNQGQQTQTLLQKFLNAYYRFLEEKYVSNAAFITTAAAAYSKKFMEIHPEKEMYLIYNGYDEEYFFDDQLELPPRDKFIISYTGIIYPHQQVEMFLDGLEKFVSNRKIKPGQLEVHFYGLDLWAGAILRIKKHKPNLLPYIFFNSKVPYSEMVKILHRSHLLLLLSKKGVDWLNAKIFDYLASKRNILLVENDKGILEQLLIETNGGFAAANSDEVYEVLNSEYNSFINGTPIAAQSNDFYKKYSRRKQAEIFATLLKQNYLDRN